MDSWEVSGPWLKAEREEWSFHFLVGEPEELSGFVDVHSYHPQEGHFVGTVATPESVSITLDRHKTTGETLGGLYFWTTGLILVRSMERDILLAAMFDVAQSGQIHNACEVVDDT